MKNKNYTFSKYPLYSNETPRFRKSPKCKYVPCGRYNDYPDYLAYLYNNSGIHNAIVRGKSDYVFGKGFQIKEDWAGDKSGLEKVMKSINATQTLDEMTRKAIFEKTLYGGKYYLIDWGNGVTKKPISVTLQAFNTVRTDADCETFWVSKNWTKEMSVEYKFKRGQTDGLPDDAKEYPAFDKEVMKGKQILFVKDDNPASDVYPLPEYESGKTSIETDIECGYFHLNNVKSGFAAGTMVTFRNGVIDDEDGQAEVERSFKKKAAGTDNAGEVLMNFQNPGTEAPVVSPLRSNELDKQYEQLSKDVINKTLVAHRVSNGLLFGIKTPGELGGGRSEFDLAWEHFCNTYVKPRQAEESEDVNYILTLYGIEGEPLELVVLDPIGIELTTDTIMKYLNPEDAKELVYRKMGLEMPEEDVKNDLISTISSVSPLIANELLNSVSVNEIRSVLGLPPVADGDISATQIDIQKELIRQKTIPETKMSRAFRKFQDDTILAKFMTIGESADDFEIVMELGGRDDADTFALSTAEDKIVNVLKKNKKLSIKDLAGLVNMSIEKVYKLLDKLNAANVLAVKYIETNGRVTVQVEEITKPKEIELLTKWKYAGPRESEDGIKNRDFCAQMMKSNRLYTRAEIDQLNNDMEDFNTDVWKYKGGWYHDPVRDVNVPQCRHFWQNILVRRKSA